MISIECFLLANDSDPFNKWEAGLVHLRKTMISLFFWVSQNLLHNALLLLVIYYTNALLLLVWPNRVVIFAGD